MKFHPNPFQSLLLSVHLQCGLEAGDPYIFPNSKFVQAKRQLRDDPSNSLVLHLPMCVIRMSDISIKLDCYVAITVAKDTGMCTALVHPRALLEPYIHPFMINSHVNSMFFSKCSRCRILSHRIYGKTHLLLLGKNWRKQEIEANWIIMFNLCSFCEVDGLRAWIKIEFRFPSSPPVANSQSWKHHQIMR